MSNLNTPHDDARPEPRWDRSGALAPAVRALSGLRARLRAMLVFRAAALMVAGLVACVLLLGLIDFALRMPTGLRVGLWALGVGAIVLAAWRFIVPAARFAPSLVDLALRIERTDDAKRASLQGLLATGVELSQGRAAGGELAPALAEPVIREAGRRFREVRLSSLIERRPVARAAAMVAMAVAAVVVISLVQPTLASIGARRVLMPWSEAQWPKRTVVVDLTGARVHALGNALAIRAALVRSPAPAAHTRVVARYQVISAGTPGPLRRVVLTNQDRPATDAQGRELGTLFERLIEPSGLSAGDAAATDAVPDDAELVYWLETEDDRTDEARVRLVMPPAVRSAHALVTAPAYVGGTPRSIELGAGTDDRAIVTGLLEGSRIELVLQLNKPVPAPTGPDAPDTTLFLDRTFGEAASWLAAAIAPSAGDAAPANDVAIEFKPDAWTMRWTLAEPVRLPIVVTDEHGISAEEVSFRFDAVKDREPTATITAPAEDLTALPGASLDAAGEARDDVGVESLTLEVRRGRPPAGSEGAPAEPIDEWTEIARSILTPAAVAEGNAVAARASPTQAVVAASLDLALMELSPGDEVWLTAVARDTFALGANRHSPVRSSVRRIRIISEQELVEQIWAELAAVRRAAIRTDEQQYKLQTDMDRPLTSGEVARGQASVTDSITAERATVEQLQQTADRNRLSDEATRRILQEAAASLDRAGRASVQAGEQAAQAAEQEQREGEVAPEQREDVQQAQEDVREQLADLIGLLDQGQDTWALQREVERLIAEQQALQQATAAQGQATTGRPLSELSQQELEALQRLAEEQQSLAQRVADAIRQMLDREQEMRQDDPAASDAMAQAAERGQRDRVREQMEQAAAQIQDNQTNSAGARQQQAIESLEGMLGDLQRASQNRDEVLRRVLSSLIESIEALIAEQQKQINLLRSGRATGEFAGLDLGMMRLHQRTLGVVDEAAGGPREVLPIADILDEAAAAQAAATIALRDQPVNPDEAEAQETLSLEKLEAARDEAKRIDEQAANRENQRKRTELKKAYEQALQEQTRLREETADLASQEQNRRTRAAARGVGERQTTLRTTLSDLRIATAELSDAVMFDYAHDRLDAIMAEAAAALANGDASNAVLRWQDRAVKLLASLVDALSEAEQEEDDQFRESESAGGGQQGGQDPPLVPPLAQVKLLRAMQQDAADQTREFDELGPDADAAELTEILRLQRNLAERGQTLLESLSNRGGQPPSPPPASPPADPGEPGGSNPPEPPADRPPSPDPPPPGSP